MEKIYRLQVVKDDNVGDNLFKRSDEKSRRYQLEFDVAVEIGWVSKIISKSPQRVTLIFVKDAKSNIIFKRALIESF